MTQTASKHLENLLLPNKTKQNNLPICCEILDQHHHNNPIILFISITACFEIDDDEEAIECHNEHHEALFIERKAIAGSSKDKLEIQHFKQMYLFSKLQIKNILQNT